MARKKLQTPSQITTPSLNVVAVGASDYINTSSKEYAIYTAQNRAIPSSCDGLKDGQRKALWGIKSRNEKIKTISLSGLLISEGWYLHGDVSASETISRLAAPYLNNVPLLEGIGAFGTRVAPDGWGAPRYTYVKTNRWTHNLIYPDMDIVPLKPNYDGSVLEPANFLPLIPLVLLNGISGIAVGWSTEILPHKLDDLISATVSAIDHKPIAPLLPHFEQMSVGIRSLGDNSYEFQGQVTIESDTLIRITELPPDLSLERFKARLNQMEDNNEIHTYTDRSTKTINIEVRFKRGAISNWTEAAAINFFKLKSKTTQRLVVLDFNNTSIKQYDTAEQLVQAFVEWRVGWYSVRFRKQIAQLTRDLNFACAVKACVVGKLPQFLATAANKAAVSTRVLDLTKKITLDDDQVDRIVSFPSYRWAQDSIAKIDDEIAALGKQIVDLEQILLDPKQIRQIYKKEVLALRK